jgi:multidrug efflux pump subunit AcrA (membrane-fusion protein)
MVMENSIEDKYQLEPQQYERLYFEEDIPLTDISRGLGTKLLIIGIGLFIVAMVVANVIKYPDQLELPFVLRGNDREHVYTFPFPVYIREVYVQPGEQVLAGQPLLRLTSPEIAAMIAEVEGKAAKKETFRTYTGSAYQRQRDILDQEILQLEAKSSQLNSDIKLLEQQWASRSAVLDVVQVEAQDHFESAQKLFKEGIISRFDLQEKEKLLAQAKDNKSNSEGVYQRDRLSLETNLQQAQQSIASSRLEKSKLEFDKAAQSGDLESDATAARDVIESIFGSYRIEEGSVVLLSAGAHRVSFVFEGDDEIHSGMTVLKLSQGNKADFAFIKCPPSAAGKLREGMKVKLKVSSFPYYEWGVVEGTVTTRSISPDENGEYNLQVSLDHLKRLEGKLFPGLDGSAVVILEEKTLFQYFFRDLARAYHGTMDGDFIKTRPN